MSLLALSRNACTKLYEDAIRSQDPTALRTLCKSDLFFLLTRGCKRIDMDNDWCFARCREVQQAPDGYLDLWAREHYKSSIITFGMTILNNLNNPELTFGFFSHTRPIAKAFLIQIKREFEMNTFLQNLFPDVLFKDPQKESPLWSLDSGIILKRKGNPKEATIEAWGLVDGQPTSKHFGILVYDDVVTKESVTTPEMIEKVTDALALSYNLGAKDGKRRYIGTRYHQLDTYKIIMDRGSANPRIYPATTDGKTEGTPVFMTTEALAKKRADMGPYIFGAQMLLNPVAESTQGFKDEWLERYQLSAIRQKWNYYLLCDPANEKTKKSDSTVMAVIGLAPDLNYYLVDGVRDRMNLTERARILITLHRKWKPIKTVYEKYGKDADIDHVKQAQDREEYRFSIEAVGGSMAKNDRIRRLIPIFEQHRFWIPRRMIYKTVAGDIRDFAHDLLTDEYSFFPVCSHDDMLDCLSRIADISISFPKEETKLPYGIPRKENIYDPLRPSHNKVLG